MLPLAHRPSAVSPCSQAIAVSHPCLLQGQVRALATVPRAQAGPLTPRQLLATPLQAVPRQLQAEAPLERPQVVVVRRAVATLRSYLKTGDVSSTIMSSLVV